MSEALRDEVGAVLEAEQVSPRAYAVLVASLCESITHVYDRWNDFSTLRERAMKEFPANDEIAWVAVAYAIHNFYNALEHYFQQINQFTRGHLETRHWHGDLVDRMALDVPGIRPALLRTEEIESFHELRSFRRAFRSVFDRRLDIRRVAIATAFAEDAMATIEVRHGEFCAAVSNTGDTVGNNGAGETDAAVPSTLENV